MSTAGALDALKTADSSDIVSDLDTELENPDRLSELDALLEERNELKASKKKAGIMPVLGGAGGMTLSICSLAGIDLAGMPVPSNAESLFWYSIAAGAALGAVYTGDYFVNRRSDFKDVDAELDEWHFIDIELEEDSLGAELFDLISSSREVAYADFRREDAQKMIDHYQEISGSGEVAVSGLGVPETTTFYDNLIDDVGDDGEFYQLLRLRENEDGTDYSLHAYSGQEELARIVGLSEHFPILFLYGNSTRFTENEDEFRKKAGL